MCQWLKVQLFTHTKSFLIFFGISALVLTMTTPISAAMIPFAFWRSPVCIFATNTTITSANVATYSNCIWDIQAATTVTVNYTSTITINGLKIASTGVLTHRACTTTSCTPIILTINGDTTITSGGKITADGLGYLGSYQTGPDAVTNSATTGQTYNFAAGAATTAGGSHGGWGGWNSAVSANTPNPPLGSIKYPDAYGSGGGGVSSTYKGGTGGGGIRLVITGTLTLDGNGTTPAISANGADGNCGGGAGGSLDITAKNISSSTSGLLISSNGGVGGSAATCVGGNISGGGGGGRIALNYTNALQGTMAISNTFVRAYGGTQVTSVTTSYGGSGTIAVGTPTTSDLYIYGPYNSTYTYNGTPIGAFGWIASITAGSVSFASLTSQMIAGQYAGLISPDADAVTLAAPAITGTTNTSISNLTVDFTTVSAVGRMWTVYDTRYNLWDNLYISDASIVYSGYLYINNLTSISNTSKLVTPNISSTTLNLNDTATLSHFPGDLNYAGRLKISANNITIASGASINVDGLGYIGGRKIATRGTNSSQKGLTLGLTTNGGADRDTGGSHGGIGGYDESASYKTYYPGVAYDSISAPTEAGGGAGTADTSNPYDPGGSGGGVIIINGSGTLTINGTISAKGGNYVSGYGGGGAGGSIQINTPTISSSSAGTVLTAAGGNGYGGGGGGRISLSYTTLSGTMAISSGKITVNAGTANATANDGSAGTIFTYQNGVSGYGTLSFFDNKLSNFRGTPLSPYGLITSSTTTTITDSSLTTNGRDFTFTAAQVVGKLITVNTHLASTTNFTITAYNPATGVFTVSGGDASTLTAGTYWFIRDFNTYYDNVNLSSNTKLRTPYFNATTITSLTGKSPVVELLRLDAGTINLSAGSPVLDAWYSNGTIAPQPLVITATTFTLGSSAMVNAAGSGYIGGNNVWNNYMGREGWCNNNTNNGYTNGNTTTGGSALYSGGSNGGYGGIYSSSTPATPFGDGFQPFSFGGGGGGNTSVSTASGGAGGGVVKIDVSGTFTVNGMISVQGYPVSTATSSAGGAGGSIWITAGTATSSVNAGHMNATGGSPGTSAETGACGGGGGRIALYYGTLGGFFGPNYAAAQGGVAKSPATCHGGVGVEFYKKNSDTYGDLSFWNEYSEGNYLPTPLPAYNFTVKNFMLDANARVKQMSAANAITVTTGIAIGSGTLNVPNDQSNVGPYNNAVPVGTWFNATSGMISNQPITEY